MTGAEDAAAGAEAEPWRIVLADDAADLRAALVRWLQRDPRFVVVGQAGDGGEAVEVVTRERPDLLLLDLSMPVLDGFSVLPTVRETCPATVVVVLSGFDGEHMERRALDLGAAMYIEKGEMFEQLHELLARVLTP